MKKFIIIAALAALCLPLAGMADANTVSGQVFFHTGEEAPCVSIWIYAYADTDCLNSIGGTATDSCGNYSWEDDRLLRIKAVFTDTPCAAGGWTGTCPSPTSSDCRIIDLGSGNLPFEDFDLEMPDCDNTGCPE